MTMVLEAIASALAIFGVAILATIVAALEALARALDVLSLVVEGVLQ
jgi:hypothetical protein